MESPLSQYSNQKPKVKLDLLGWWKAFSIPPDPPPGASFKQKDAVRRARLASIILFWLIAVMLVVLALGIFGSEHALILVAAILLTVCVFAAWLNRKGMITIVGLIISLGIEVGVCVSAFSNPGGIGTDNLMIFSILILPEVLVASLLPVNWVIPTALFNIALTIFGLTYAPRQPAFQAIMAHEYLTIVLRPIELHILIPAVLWLWVRSATDAIKRADRAEEIAKLQRVVADQMLEKVNQKRQLDAEIQQIELVLDQSAVGNLNARVALQSGNTLWSISGKLNNLISRFKRMVQERQQMQRVLSQQEKLYLAEQKYQRMVHELESLGRAVQQAQSSQSPVQIAPSGTPLDMLMQSINGKYIAEHPLESSSNRKKETTSDKKIVELVNETSSEASPNFTRIARYSQYRRPDW